MAKAAAARLAFVCLATIGAVPQGTFAADRCRRPSWALLEGVCGSDPARDPVDVGAPAEFAFYISRPVVGKMSFQSADRLAEYPAFVSGRHRLAGGGSQSAACDRDIVIGEKRERLFK